jgi:hypothetical protein
MVGLGCLGGGSDHHRETDSGIERLSSAGGGGRPGGSAAPPPGGNSSLVSQLPGIVQNFGRRGSISQRYGSGDLDPDPHQNFTDPLYCIKLPMDSD